MRGASRGKEGSVKAPRSTVLSIPWPPTVNSYWRHANGRTLLSADGRKYRAAVYADTAEALFRDGGFRTGRIAMRIVAHPPDRRRRDLDNILKAPLDALQKAGMYDDDSQIDVLEIRRGDPCDGGCLVVEIEEIRA